MIRSTLVAVTVVAMLALAACGQGVGERCQLDRDCANGLTCVLPPNGTREIGGKCEAPTTNLDMPAYLLDFSLQADFSDASAVTDLTAPDLTPAD
jgi:hypothetical protein